MNTKLFSLILILLFFETLCQAQEYKTSIGLRLGAPNAISGKFFINNHTAFEAIIGKRSNNTLFGAKLNSLSQFTVLHQFHKSIGSVDGLSIFLGLGPNIYLYTFESDIVGFKDSYWSYGVAGTLGLDYKLEFLPLNFSIDWMPIYSLSDFRKGFDGGPYAITARYVIN